MYFSFNFAWYSVNRLGNRTLEFFKKYSIIAQFKALNERISEWAYFLNLDKLFQRYLRFSAPKRGGFVDKSLRETSYLKWYQKHNGFL